MKATKWLYSSPAWKRVRKEYYERVGGLCEDCLARGIITPGDEVHHKIFITPANMHDPSIALNPDNLVLLCKQCHAKRHGHVKRYKVSPDGRVIVLE
jgi:5-methylcytosine-specific restriction endonuclease McrA